MVRNVIIRLRLLVASALSCAATVACAQIAGFDHLSSRSSEADDGGSSSASGGTFSAAGKADAIAGRHFDVAGSGPNTSGGTEEPAGSGGKVNSGSAGRTETGGSAGKAANGGTGGHFASGGNVGNGGSTPIGGSAATAGAAGAPVIGGCNAELLRNGNFDAGPVDWRMESTAPGITEVSDIITKGDNARLVAANVAPYSGNYLAWLGGTQNTDKGTHMNLQQDVQIPLKVSRLIVSGWIQIKSTEPDPQFTADQIDLTLQDVDPKYYSFHFWKGTEVTNGWKFFSYDIYESTTLDIIRGRTMPFYAESIADTGEISSFWLDSISLFAECPH